MWITKKYARLCSILVFANVGVYAITMVVGYYAFRRINPTVSESTGPTTVPEIEKAIQNQAPFSPPAPGELTQSQVERLVQVQTRVREQAGARAADLEREHERLLEKRGASVVDRPELVATYRHLVALWLELRRTQVEALNDAGFSRDEYRWVRRQAYSALGLPVVEIDMAKLIDEINRGETESEAIGSTDGSIGPSGPVENRKLVEIYKKQLEDAAVLVTFGL